MYRYIEAYIKRLLFIGLRLRNVKYNESSIIVESTYMNTKNLIEKVLYLLDKSGDKQKKIVTKLKYKYKDFFTLNELLLNFSSKYRNWLAHGIIAELKDRELINYLCHVNKSYIKEFETLLQNEYGHSAFDKPGDWGARRGIDEEIGKTVKRLHLGKIVDKPLPLQIVKNKLSGTKYAKT